MAHSWIYGKAAVPESLFPMTTPVSAVYSRRSVMSPMWAKSSRPGLSAGAPASLRCVHPL